MSVNHFEILVQRMAANLPELTPSANDASDKLKLSLAWVGHYLNVGEDCSSDVILKGAYGCAVESVSLMSLGFLRPAILSLRSHYELCLQYLFFRDHPREMQSLLDYRVQGPLPGAVKKYLKDHSPHFESRLTKLSKVKRGQIEDVYSVLSGIAHGNAINSISLATIPADLLESKGTIEQSIAVYESVGEVVSDYFLSDFSSNWMSVPSIIRTDAAERFQTANPGVELSM